MSAGKRPGHFDRNLIVIGAGSAGLVSAYVAAAVNAGVSLIEKDRMGGDCLNTGCVPSKAFIRSARFLSHVHRHSDFGFREATAEYDFSDIMARVRRVIETIAPHDSVERYSSLGVDCIAGEARLLSPWHIRVNDRELTARNIIIATGANPLVPPIKGIEQINYLTSDNVWYIDSCPGRLVILGGGPIGCELAQAFARFGSQVTLIEMLPGILDQEDPEITGYMARQFTAEGIDIRAGHKAIEVEIVDGQQRLVCDHAGQRVELPFDELLVAVGRKAVTEGFGLEEVGVELTDRGTIAVNEYLQSSVSNIYACGDVAGPFQFTHTASHQAWYATVNAMFGQFWKFRVDYSIIPRATFTDPEVARVGLNEKEARAAGIPYEVSCYEMSELDRAIVESADSGFVKVLTRKGKDRILGATIVAEHAGELITEYVSAMKHDFGLNSILGTIHIYPTMSEANKYVAGIWKRNHAPYWALALLKKYHNWMRN